MGSPEREFIEQIRRVRFSIGSDSPNPLASSLHGAIRHLSAELYQKDVNFISELIQNAEDNVYEAGLEPELDLILTPTDVAGVGAESTLTFFNNEVGFQRQNISALCDIDHSTKKGQRNEGFIGEKGIGFKSVFVVTCTPYVISNGFRIRFSDTKTESDAQIGYIVPEWVTNPTDDQLRELWQSSTRCLGEKLPSTSIVLPLRAEKVPSVQAELKQLSPETILFLRKITRIQLRDETRGKVFGGEVMISRIDSQFVRLDNMVVRLSRLSVVKQPSKISETCNYVLCQQDFEVTASVEQRNEVKTWVVTLAFPQGDRIAGGSSGDLYAFLPSQLRTGLPFIISADFLLVASRETLKFDSPWNLGILDCVPTVFCKALTALLQNELASKPECKNFPTLAPPFVYKYVPVVACGTKQFEGVREKILSNLKSTNVLLVAENVGHSLHRRLCKPCMGRRVQLAFRKILEKTYSCGVPSLVVHSSSWSIIDSHVQENFSAMLDQLGVPEMTFDEYMLILGDKMWISRIREDLYLDVLGFLWDLRGQDMRYQNQHLKVLKILKCDQDHEVAELLSIAEINEAKIAVYESAPEQGGWLCTWISKFSPWFQYRFLPQKTITAMNKSKGSNSGVLWLRSVAKVSKIDAQNFAKELVSRCSGEVRSIDATFVLLVWRFIYTTMKEYELKCQLPKRFAVVDEKNQVVWCEQGKQVLLMPRGCSNWPLLFTHRAWSSSSTLQSKALIIMSDEYLKLHAQKSEREYNANEDILCNVFLQTTFGASDLPNLTVPVVGFPELESLNAKQSRLLLQWLTYCLQKGPSNLSLDNEFGRSLKRTQWLHTEQHGLRVPGRCFMPNWNNRRSQLNSSDVPFIDESFYGDLSSFQGILDLLGVICVPSAKSCEVLVRFMFHPTFRSSLTQTRVVGLYDYLRIYKWQPSVDPYTATFCDEQVYIPAGYVDTASEAKLVKAADCIVRDPENLFRGVVPVISTIYPRYLIPFFENVLKVPLQASNEKYYELWLRWRECGVQYDLSMCAKLWERIAVYWDSESCSPSSKEAFKAKAWLPVGDIDGEGLQLVPPHLTLIPDDLQLRSIFMAQASAPLFVWYPKGSSKLESKLNGVYEYLGAMKLSDCVNVTTDLGANVKLTHNLVMKPKFITRGLIIAILGFVSQTELSLSSKKRQAVITPLCKSVEIELGTPGRILYRISKSSSVLATTATRELLGYFDPTGVLYRLGQEHELLKDPINVRRLETQVLESICANVLAVCPTVAASMVDFLKQLVGCAFDEAAVEHELLRKNFKLYKEDLEFLGENLSTQSSVPSMKAGFFSSLTL